MKNNNLREEIITLITKVINIPKKNINEQLKIGEPEEWDSLAHIEIICALEEKYQIQFNINELEKMMDLDSIVKIVREKNE